MVIYEYEIVNFSPELDKQGGKWLSEKLESAFRKYDWFRGLKNDKVITNVTLDDFTLQAIKRTVADLKFTRTIDTDTENAINSLIKITIDTLLERKYNTAITLIEATRELSKRTS